jgi:hypothetical protein
MNSEREIEIPVQQQNRLVIGPTEAGVTQDCRGVIREIFRRCSEGVTVAAILEALTQSGLPITGPT